MDLKELEKVERVTVSANFISHGGEGKWWDCEVVQAEDYDQALSLIRSQQELLRAREWVSVDEQLPKQRVPVDLWIEGEPRTVTFYDPTQKRSSTSGRTTNWVWDGQRWCCVEGLSIFLSIGVTATHWRLLPAPPEAADALLPTIEETKR